MEKVTEMRYYYLCVYLWSCVSRLLLRPSRFSGAGLSRPCVGLSNCPAGGAATFRLQGVTQCVLTFRVSTQSYGCQCLGILTSVRAQMLVNAVAY